MAHACPRCGKPVQRGYSSGAQFTAGLVGALFYAAFGPFQCATCGKIPTSEFPPEVRRNIILTSAGLAVAGVVLLVGVLCLMAIGKH